MANPLFYLYVLRIYLFQGIPGSDFHLLNNGGFDKGIFYLYPHWVLSLSQNNMVYFILENSV